MSEPAWRVVGLLAAAFREAVDELHRDLAEQGHPDARPLHGFTLQAIGPDGCTIAQLAERLGVSKQAAAKTAAGMASAGYVEREPVPGDRRAVLLRRTARADDLLRLSERGFRRVLRRWRREVGGAELDAMVAALTSIAGNAPIGDLPGWLTRPSS